MHPIVDNLGKPLANMIVKVCFDIRRNQEGADETYKSAVRTALDHFSTPLTVTENGYLLADMNQGLPVLTALLDVNDNVARLACLGDIIRGERESHGFGGVQLNGLPYGIATVVYEQPHLKFNESPKMLRTCLEEVTQIH